MYMCLTNSCWIAFSFVTQKQENIVRLTDLTVLFLFYFVYLFGCTAYGILVPWPEIEPSPSAVKA